METSSETSEAESGGQPQVLPPKTRSCDDLVAAVLADSSGSNTRRLSDPNIASDPQSLLMSVRDGSVVGFHISYLISAFSINNKVPVLAINVLFSYNICFQLIKPETN